MLGVCLAITACVTPLWAGASGEDIDMDVSDVLNATYEIKDLAGKYKVQGRSAMVNDVLMLDYSASGIEFYANCSGDLSVTFNAPAVIAGDEGGCYFTVIVDGVKKARDFCRITATGETEVVLAENLTPGDHTFEIYRQTEIERATVGISAITLSGELLSAPKNNDLYVEFVGDSITTAYGNLTLKSDGVATPSYPKYQDATQGYAYLTARKLGADWSLVARQGIGASVGYQKVNMQTVYPLLRYGKDGSTQYDFARQPDYVVIALGTNDLNTYNNATYANPVMTLDQVKKGFADMLALVRTKNPNAKIVWAYNMMTNKANNLITEVINEAGGADNGYYSVQLSQGTTGGNGHPYYTTHETMANELSKFIKDIEKPNSYTPGDINDDETVDLNDVVTLAQVVACWQNVVHNEDALDCDGSGAVDLNDVVILAQFVAGWKVELK